jgi:hypothetical protein
MIDARTVRPPALRDAAVRPMTIDADPYGSR